MGRYIPSLDLVPIVSDLFREYQGLAGDSVERDGLLVCENLFLCVSIRAKGSEFHSQQDSKLLHRVLVRSTTHSEIEELSLF